MSLYDADGKLSSGRIMFIVFFVNLIIITNWFAFTHQDLPPGIERFLTWGYGICFGGSVLKTGTEALKKLKSEKAQL